MAIKGVDPKCYILALFVREDGERFLLGSGRYVFKEKQQHFQANKMANDVIEVQGNDGYLLAGQVRRPGTQDFDGYVGDGTSSKEQVEQWRRDFFKFFRKNYLYKVIYVFSDGSAIQRKRGFLVDAPTVEELYQIYPEYHVALNFEDINYYFYNEDSDGNEIYGKSAIIGLTVGATGGLMWDNLGAISLPYSWLNPVSVSGTDIQINNQLSDEVPITDLQLAGDTFQQTYSGKNLLDYTTVVKVSNDTTLTLVDDGFRSKTTSSGFGSRINISGLEPSTTYTLSWVLKIEETCNPVVRCFKGTVQSSSYFIASSLTDGSMSRTFTTDADGTAINIWFYNGIPSAGQTLWTNIQLEKSASPTPYEPYVGGTPSPNPDDPQAINVVTGEQTVNVHGKNLLGLDNFSGSFSSNQYTEFGKILDIKSRYGIAAALDVTLNTFKYTKTTSYDSHQYWKFKGLQPNANYAVSCNYSITSESTTSVYLFSAYRLASDNSLNLSFTTDENGEKEFGLQFYGAAQNDVIELTNLMVVEGLSATSYEPYQSTTKTINLGSTELAKIGTYQDYIYKSGDDWYVHKAIAKTVFNGSENWGYAGSGTQTRFYITLSDIALQPYSASAPIVTVSNAFTGINWYQFYTTAINNVMCSHDSSHLLIVRATQFADASAFETWLSTHNTTVYYALATPTDTKITDATLVGQLDDLMEGTKLFIGENNVLVTANGSNLPATLSFKYYTGINYDGAGFEWEAGGSGGDDMITVDSIDDVYPMLTIPGPVVNPTITNVTTGSVFQYTGTLSSTQTLEVDLMAKTAFLNGVSVIANVTSSSLYFKSGMNRVSYTTNNADAPDATIKWQEIVG